MYGLHVRESDALFRVNSVGICLEVKTKISSRLLPKCRVRCKSKKNKRVALPIDTHLQIVHPIHLRGPERGRQQRVQKLMTWIEHVRMIQANGCPLSGPLLLVKGKWFPSEMKVPEPFAACRGWLRCFKFHQGTSWIVKMILGKGI